MKSGTSILLLLILPFMQFAQNEPKAKKKDHILEKFNHKRNDPYFWMNERDSKEVLDYIGQENTYTQAYFKKLKPLQDKLMKEFDARINPNQERAPYFLNGKEFFSKSIENKDYEITYVKEKGKQLVFFDENERAKGKSYYGLADWALSKNNEYLAFSEDYIGRRKYSIFFREEKSKKFLKDEIKDTDGSIVWGNDNKTVFYVRKDPQTLREFQVYRHTLGTDTKTDVLVYEEKDERFGVSIEKTISNKYIIINTQSSTTNEQLLIDANKATEAYKIFLTRTAGHLYEVEDNGSGFYVTSNDQAPNKKVLYFASWPTSISQGEVIIKHNPEVLIESKLTLKNKLILEARKNGLMQIQIMDLASRSLKNIEIKEETYSMGLASNHEYEAEHIFYAYNSMTTPYSIFKYNLVSNTSELFFQQKLIDKNFSPSNYESKRVWATANDGTKIPISLIYKKGIDLSKAPLLLYGYGSYGVTIPASFSATRISLLNRGFVYAIAHIRGEKYLGENWYENGKFQKKRNTFTDFINAAEFLGNHGYCDASKIYAQGGSAGGLLMGAVTNMAPYLWKGVVAQVPFVDVVTTMLDESIPLTVGEYEEWGNPNEEEFYWYMHSYSPYDQVKRMDYPALYITTGYHDSQVQYWEPLKWLAKLRDYRTNNNPLLFDCNMDAGHGGGSGRTNERLEIAKEFSFILGLEGILE